MVLHVQFLRAIVINCNNYGYPFTFHLAQSLGQNVFSIRLMAKYQQTQNILIPQQLNGFIASGS